MEAKDLIGPILTLLGLISGAFIMVWKLGLLAGDIKSQHKEAMSTIELSSTKLRGEFSGSISELKSEMRVSFGHIEDGLNQTNYRVGKVEESANSAHLKISNIEIEMQDRPQDRTTTKRSPTVSRVRKIQA